MTKNDADPHFLRTAQLSKFLGSACDLPPSSNASADNPTSLNECSYSQSPGHLARLPSQSLAVQQEPTPHWVADGSGSKIWTDKLAISPFARLRVSDTCLWDKYQGNGENTLRGGIVVRSELHNFHQREVTTEALLPCATEDYSSRYSEEGDQNDQLLWHCAQLATNSEDGRTRAVVREDSKPASAVTSLKPSLHRSSI